MKDGVKGGVKGMSPSEVHGHKLRRDLGGVSGGEIGGEIGGGTVESHDEA